MQKCEKKEKTKTQKVRRAGYERVRSLTPNPLLEIDNSVSLNDNGEQGNGYQ